MSTPAPLMFSVGPLHGWLADEPYGSLDLEAAFCSHAGKSVGDVPVVYVYRDRELLLAFNYYDLYMLRAARHPDRYINQEKFCNALERYLRKKLERSQ